ncbi:uncharacterized phage protein [Aeromonas sp. RU39B]|uniref:TIGR02642 family protein n=1 Tax=Aeromonas sp. RU39B TaxID=1907416 RepID=UPI000955BFAD|nr:TIGR02642 family protein [Aeromonas sp. RU39B]SIQ70579.1 uncharacterized phage protein [Aeromonas sp. RU39B]
MASIEMALRLFSPRGSQLDVAMSGKGILGREEILGALQAAAVGRQLGYHYLMAEHLMDDGSVRALSDHFTQAVGKDAAGAALALLLRRPLPDQLEHMIKARSGQAHPYYDKERRRASIVMEQAKRAHRRGNEIEYQRLKNERDHILTAAYNRCADEILQTGRCPTCQGTGKRVRAGTECPSCNGTGRVVPDRVAIRKQFSAELCYLMEREVDNVLAQASELTSEMAKQISDMLAA